MIVRIHQMTNFVIYSLTFIADAEVELAEQFVVARLVVDGELLARAQLPLTQITGETSQVINVRSSLSHLFRDKEPR